MKGVTFGPSHLPDVLVSGECYILDPTLIELLLSLALTVDLSVPYKRKKNINVIFWAEECA